MLKKKIILITVGALLLATLGVAFFYLLILADVFPFVDLPDASPRPTLLQLVFLIIWLAFSALLPIWVQLVTDGAVFRIWDSWQEGRQNRKLGQSKADEAEIKRTWPPTSFPDDVVGRQLSSYRSSGAELWVVASGKGGVGKTTIALGLLEALSREGPVVLADFDLHNRGLTSLLYDSPVRHDETSFNLLTEFRRMLETAPEGPYRELHEARRELPVKFTAAHFNDMVAKFSTRARNDPNRWDNLTRDDDLPARPKLFSVNGRKIDVGDGFPLNPRNAYFIASRNAGPEERFLLSQAHDSSYLHVYFFLQALRRWLKVAHKVNTIILDCHGSHDLTTVGAILAADKLVVVTTPDPGAYDGTAELLEFATEVDKARPRPDMDTVVALNQRLKVDTEQNLKAISQFEELKTSLAIKALVNIESDQSVSRVNRGYRFGRVSETPVIWNGVIEIKKAIDSRKPVSPEKPTKPEKVEKRVISDERATQLRVSDGDTPGSNSNGQVAPKSDNNTKQRLRRSELNRANQTQAPVADRPQSEKRSQKEDRVQDDSRDPGKQKQASVTVGSHARKEQGRRSRKVEKSSD